MPRLLKSALRRTFPFLVFSLTVAAGASPAHAAPTTPGPVTVSDVTGNRASLSWGASTSPGGVDRYIVTLNGGPRYTPGNGPTMKLSGLTPSTEYSGTVQAFSFADGTSEGRSFSFSTTARGPLKGKYRFDLYGSGSLPTIEPSPSAIEFNGGLELDFSTPTTFKGRFELDPASVYFGNAAEPFTVGGTVLAVPAGPITGTLVDGKLTATGKFRFKLRQGSLNGAELVDLANNCQTKRLSDITWRGTDVDPEYGFDLKSDFSISDLNGCAPMSALIFSNTAGSNNQIDIAAFVAP